MQLRGCYTALITPFKNGRVDLPAFKRFINWQIEQGIHGLVPCGTTGESPTMTYDEHNKVNAECIKAAKGRVPVIAGTGANGTEEAVMLTKFAQKAGADAALLVTPYYNKPSPAGVLAHFKAVHDATNIPIVVYNIPGRSVIDINDDTMQKIANLPRVIAVKDATGDLTRPLSLRQKLGRKASKITLLSGEDATAVAFNASGGKGVISVSSNIAPKQCAAVQDATLEGDFAKALRLQEKLLPLHDAMFCETSPGPVKYAASLLGFCGEELRLPLVPPTKENKQRIKSVLKSLNITGK